MNLKFKVRTNLKIPEVQRVVHQASEKAFKNVVIDIANDVIKIHPWKTRTGNNSRSIKYDIKGLSGSVYSTSGYGGYLETGTVYMDPFPYFKPALDRHIGKLPGEIKAELKKRG